MRVAACTPWVRPADVAFNAALTQRLMEQAHDTDVGVCIFPELEISGYAIDDLLMRGVLLTRVEAELTRLVEASRRLRPLFVIGMPWIERGRLHNCAVVFHAARILGVVPKTYLPNYREICQPRWFASGAGVTGRTVKIAGQEVGKPGTFR